MPYVRALFALVSVLIASTPFTVFAADTSFFGPIIPGKDDQCYCLGTAMDWGCALQIFQSVLNVVVSLGVLAVVFFIAWAGFLLVTGGSNPGMREKAKNRMLNAVVGLVIILGAWTIIDTVMKVLYNPDTAFEGGTFGPWNALLAPSDNYCLKKNETPGILNNGSLTTVLNPGTTNSSTAAGTGPGGPLPGSFTYDHGIEAQKGDTSAAVTSLLTCMAGKLPAGVGRISSISDSAITSGKKTFVQCASLGQAGGCAHTAGSCHYGGNTCVGRSFAVDFGDDQNASVLRQAALTCGATYTGFEGTHLHVSVGKSCGCN